MGNHQLRAKQSTQVQSQSITLQLMTQHLDHSWRELMLLSVRQKVSFHFIPLHGKAPCKKMRGKKRQSFLLIKENILHAESVKKTLFKAIRLSSHRLFKIRKNAGNYLFSSLIWNSFVCILGWRAEGKGEESIFLLLVAMILSKWHDLKESFMACPLQSKKACQLWDNQIWSHFYIT